MQIAVTGEHDVRICQLTDLHLGDFPLNAASQKTLSAIDRFLTQNDFDLVIVTGDLIWGKTVTRPAATLGALFDVFNRHTVPVAITYGNHDTEGAATRADLRALESRLVHPADKHHSLIVAERESYTLEVLRDGQLAHVLYVWDSGAYGHWPAVDQYAALEPEQIDWFRQLPYARSARANDLGFLHIPVPEYQAATAAILTGEHREAVCSPQTNSGLFYTLLREGNVRGLFVGHDHENNFAALYRGMTLAYGNVSGYNTYGTLPRGARVITLNGSAFSTEVQLFD